MGPRLQNSRTPEKTHLRRGFPNKASPAVACYHPAVAMSDTTPEAKAMQEQILRNMTGEQRLRIALEMTDLARELARARFRTEHPEWTEAQIVRELLRLAFFPDPLPPGLP